MRSMDARTDARELLRGTKAFALGFVLGSLIVLLVKSGRGAD